MDRALRLLQDVQLGSNAIRQLPLLEQRATLLEKQVEAYKLQLVDAHKIVDIWQAATAEQAKAREEMNSFWHSPILWFTAGFILAAGGFTIAGSLNK